MNRYVCSNCGYSSLETDLIGSSLCPDCDGNFTSIEAVAGSGGSEPNASPLTGPEHLRIDFTGTAGEYFRIWIVNTFLTILTFGIYAAWAKVRNRQYFYKNTMLAGHSFEYTADPKVILRGHLIVGAAFSLYSFTNAYNHIISLTLLAVFSLIFPLLIYKSLRFFTHNSAYRNIRFRFSGPLKEAYFAYLLVPVLVPFTLGLIIPYWFFLKKKYFFDNFAYGTTGNSFSGRPGPFYKAYFLSFFLAAVLFIFGLMAMLIFFPSAKELLHFDKELLKKAAVLLPFAMILLTLPLTIFIQQELYAWTTNYCLGNSRLGNIRLQGRLKGIKLFWITLTNLMAMFCSLGLLAPWAKIRRMRYILASLTVIADNGLDHFMAASSEEGGSYGEAATDFFDFDIGL